MKLCKIFKNRIYIIFTFIVVLFFILSSRLYFLQIIHGEEYLSDVKATTIRTIPIQSQRGNIYDRYGRPLAINKVSYSIKLDLSIVVENLNTIIIDFLNILDSKGCEYIDDLPITKEKPFEFTFVSDSAEKIWKTDMGFKGEQLNFTALEVMEYFKEYFKIPAYLSEKDIRKLVSIRCSMYIQRFKKYNSITLATDVSPEIIAFVEENKNEFPGIYVDIDSFRYYTEKETLSHVLGYIGSINEEELKEYEQYGYLNTDLIGKLGIEKSSEFILKGTDGKKVLEIDAMGRRVSEIQTIPPKNGGNVYLTIDSELQKSAFNIMKENLKNSLIKNLDSGKVSLNQVLQSMVNSNAISVKKIIKSKDGEAQYNIRNIILNDNENFDLNNLEDIKKAKEKIVASIGNGSITALQMFLCMKEQNKINIDDDTLNKLNKGLISPYKVLKDKIITDEISVNEINLDPCTGSAAVVDINTGEVLSLITYPSYDNNKLVNKFDSEYYQTLLDDPTTPLINRPLMERKAPGSVFKMLVAMAGLELGLINENTLIQDKGIYKEAGNPYAKCLIYSRYGATHGMTNVKKAIEVSCNYFFYELAYRMGNAKQGNPLDSISTLNDYMKKFGLGDYSGIEIEELKPKMATPQAKAQAIEAYDSNATENQKRWMDGDSIRCAIGQSYNSFSVMNIAKYITVLANGGTRYKTSIIKMEEYKENMNVINPVVEEELNFNKENVKIVHEGMLKVTSGNQGTLRNYFKGFPIKVAAKTGTAEEASKRPSHSWFAGFAPYDNPQIAVVVMIPFGETDSAPAIKIAKEIFEEYFNLNKETELSTIYTDVLSQ